MVIRPYAFCSAVSPPVNLYVIKRDVHRPFLPETPGHRKDPGSLKPSAAGIRRFAVQIADGLRFG